MWSAEVGSSGPTELSFERIGRLQSDIKQAKVVNRVGYQYATQRYNECRKVLNPALQVDDLISHWAPPLEPSLHIDYHPGYSIKQDNWVALLSDHRNKYDQGMLEQKQPTGHARVLSCSTRDELSTIVRSIQEPIMHTYVDASRMFNRDVLKRLFTVILPNVLAPGAWVFVRLNTPNDPDLAELLVKCAKSYSKLHLCKPAHSDLMTHEVYVVLECFGACSCSSTVEGWWCVTANFIDNWARHVKAGCDIYNLVTALGIQTDTQCRTHYEQTRQ
jgi:hypothetical protein